MSDYIGFIPPCAIYCGDCPNYTKKNNSCERKCKGIFVCCKEKKGLDYCYECKSFPCARFKKFAESWMKLGQDLIANQFELRKLGEKKWLEIGNVIE
ncbi:MAG: putative acetyltransferase [Anaerocolumna sp.]|nr:putative acetyltransferase [Anaerocolumna sp.]